VSRYRIYLTTEQESVLLRHCADARYVWNLAVEQESWWRAGRKSAPGYVEQCRQLTEARAENPWLREGCQVVQQQALRDHHWAMKAFLGGTHGRPFWRKAGRDEGFRIVGQRGKHWDVRRLNRNWGEAWVPKAGWIRFRWSRPVPDGVKSYRITRDKAGRWHIAFAAIPKPVRAPGNRSVVGIDRGVAVAAVLSTGEMLHCPGLTGRESARLRRLKRQLSKAQRASNRRGKARSVMARLTAREKDRRKDWCEKVSTDVARRFDVIRVENLNIKSLTRSAKGTVDKPGRNVAARAALNQGILGSGWGLLIRRIGDKAPGRMEKVPAAFTSQRCSVCGCVDRKSRESQALFRCTTCGYACNADVNAARNIAAGHAVKARGGDRVAGPVSREPQLLAF
jgi:putative transposase